MMSKNYTSDDELNSVFEQCTKLFQYGDTAYIQERYSDAVQLYSTVLQETLEVVMEGTHHICKKKIHFRFKCYLHRSMAYQKKEQYTLASTDIEDALQLYNEYTNSISFDVHEINLCYRLNGIITYQLQKYTDAQAIFEKILREKLYIPNDDKFNEAYYQNYIQQCQVIVKQTQQNERKTLENEPLPMDITPALTIESTSAVPPKGNQTNDSKVTPATVLFLTPKYQYYQNDTQMVIQILEPYVLPTNMSVQYIDTQHIVVHIEKRGHSITVLQGELYDAIVPDKCSVSYKQDKVVIKLRKERPNYEWQSLLSQSNKPTTKKSSAPVPSTSKTETTTDDVSNTTTQGLVPDIETNAEDTTTMKETGRTKTKIPNPYASHRDWDAIEKDVEEEIANEKPVGDAAMNQLFQQIYANADEDTKRAMIKSYQTSGGTVLSTNWNEVAKKDYEQERTAPDGQEWKTWEGKSLPKK